VIPAIYIVMRDDEKDAAKPTGAQAPRLAAE